MNAGPLELGRRMKVKWDRIYEDCRNEKRRTAEFVYQDESIMMVRMSRRPLDSLTLDRE